uniref:Leucine-rich repeat protein n=1 Tax=Paramoeba aestuarina TaxID=180227 RepID=A0A7S4KJ46_9EUKA
MTFSFFLYPLSMVQVILNAMLINSADSVNFLRECQVISMMEVLCCRHSQVDYLKRRLVSLGIVQPFAEGENLANVCGWASVVCDDNQLVTVIAWGYFQNHKRNIINLDWLPPTLTRVDITFGAYPKQRFDTRLWPRNLRSATFTECGMRGSIDLRTLPEKMETLNLSFNELSGTVHLTELPPRISKIDINHNNIEKVVVSNGELPKTLKKVNFLVNKKARAVCLDGRTLDQRVRIMHEVLIREPKRKVYMPGS